jgi:prevent-host-death family protein
MYATLRESKAKLSKLVERASAGEEVVITVRGRPKARLCPIESEPHFEGAAFVRELETIQAQYRVRGKKASPSETIVSEFREDRL